MRKKTKVRLLLALAAVIVISTLLGTGYWLRQKQLDAAARESHQEGLILLESGDYEQAMHKLGSYVRRYPDDIDALFKYAVARQQVPSPNNKHLSDAMSFYRRVLTAAPSHQEAAERLLELYEGVGFNTEQLELADRLLQSDPNHAAAHRARVVAYLRLRQFEAAYAAAQSALAASPDSLQAHLLLLDVIGRLDNALDRAAEYVERLDAFKLDAASATTLRSVASSVAGDQEKARELAIEASTMDLSSPELVRIIVEELDRHGQTEQSLDLLRRSVQQYADPALRGRLAGRLYENGLVEELVYLAETAGDDVRISALATAALFASGDEDQAAEYLQRLEALDDSLADRWVTIIRAAYENQEPDDLTLAKACREALETGDDDPHIRVIYGDTLARLGEEASARQQWRTAAQLAPAWHDPPLRLARAALSAREFVEAAAWMQEGLRRAPGAEEGLRLRATLALMGINYSQPEQVAFASEQIGAVERAGGDPEAVLVLRTQLLARTGRTDEAANLISSYLASAKADAPADALLQLASVSQAHALGFEQRLLELATQQAGLTPAIAVGYARLIAPSAPEVARQAVEAGLASADASELPQAEFARVCFLEATQDPNAAAGWASLADRYPKDVRLQWTALGAASMRSDLIFQQRTLQRLGDLVGTDSQSWQLANARLLLRKDASAGGTSNTVEAALKLRQLVENAPTLLEARLALVEALHRLGNHDAAIEQLLSAEALAPWSAQISLALGQAYQLQGNLESAAIRYRTVLQNAAATPEQRQTALELVASAGDASAALEAIERQAQARGIPPRPTPLLALLYSQNLRLQEALDTAGALAESEEPEEVAFAARFFAEQGVADRAGQALAYLESLSPDPALLEATRGYCAAAAGRGAEAVTHFEAALTYKPADAGLWRDLLAHLCRQRRFGEAQEAAKRARLEVEGDDGIEGFSTLLPRVAVLADLWPETPGLLNGVLRWPQSRDVVAKALDALEAAKTNAQLAGAVEALKPLASANQQLLALQLLTAEAAMRAGQNEEAALVASRAAGQFPRDWATARMATLALFAAQRYTEALAFAPEWQRRRPEDAAAVAQVVSAAHSRLGDVRTARATLEAHADAAMQDPAGFASLLSQLAQLRLRDGEVDGAVALLSGSISSVSQLRIAWTVIARQLPDEARGEAMLREVEPYLAADNIDEQFNFVDAWLTLWRRSGNEAHRQLAAARLKGLAESPLVNDSLQPVLAAATLFESLDELEAAERCYRRSLELSPGLPEAQNNLAMLLCNRGDGLDEAMLLAERASSNDGHPHQASFLETLAQVQSKRGQRAEAEQALRKAIAVQPQHAASRLSLIEMLVDQARLKEAQEQMKAMESQLAAGPALADPLQQRYAALSARMPANSNP